MAEVIVNLRAGDVSAVATLPFQSEPTSLLFIGNLPTFMTFGEALEHLLPELDEDNGSKEKSQHSSHAHMHRICSEELSQSPSPLVAARILLTTYTPSTYGLLLQFSSPDQAATIQRTHHNVPISALAKELVIAQFVVPSKEVHALLPEPSVGQLRSGTPIMPERSTSTYSVQSANNGSPLQDHHQTQCTICLEHFREFPTVYLPCGHQFHIACVARVEGSVCPNCRFNLAESRAECIDCGSSSDLWMCLVCGDVRCGQYSNHHAQRHATICPDHAFALQVGGMRVWDFKSASFVHRVVASLEGDEVVDTATKRGRRAGPQWSAEEEEDDLDVMAFQARIDLIADFYSRLLQRQLEAQHEYFSVRQNTATVDAVALRFSLAEAEERRQISLQCGQEYAAVLRLVRDDLTAVTLQRKRRAKAAMAEVTELDTTVSALRVNVAKLQQLNATTRKRQTQVSASLKEQEERLSKELEKIYQEIEATSV